MDAENTTTTPESHVGDECYLNQALGWWSFIVVVVTQLLWPVLGEDESDAFDDELAGLDPGSRKVWGPLYIGVFSVIFIVVLLNVLIAMLSSTYEGTSGPQT